MLKNEIAMMSISGEIISQKPHNSTCRIKLAIK